MKKIIKVIKNLDRTVLICGAAAIVVVSVIIVMLFAGGGNNEDPEEIKAEESGIEVNADAAEPEYETDAVEFGEGNIDPENDEIAEENGADVKAEELKTESGRSNGIDVSKWQGKIDWSAVKASGIDFAFIRIGYRGENGKIYKDDNADYNIQQAQKAGVLVGVYFFSTAVNESEAKEEADWTVAAVEGYAVSYPVVYDCEGYKKSSSRMYGLSASERTANAMAFLDVIDGAGYEGMFYAARNDVLTSNYWYITDIASDYKIWIAQYPSVTYPEKDKPDYSGSCAAWQYTDHGKVNGIEGNVDMVVCYFTRSEAAPKNDAAKPDDAAAPLTDEEKLYTAVNEKVTAKELTNMRRAATTRSDIVASLKNGEVVTRIGVGTNGWSKLSYNGQTVYAITSYLTTELTPVTESPETKSESSGSTVAGNTFTSVNDKVTAKIEVNLRNQPTTGGDVVAVLKNGEFLSRTGTSDKGWSRLIYNGQTVYAVTSYLTTDASPDSVETTGLSDTVPVYDGFAAVDEKVTAKDATNLRTAPSTTNSEVVYTLPSGEFIERIGIHGNGWSKLIYNGQTVYAISSYLTTATAETTDAQEITADEEPSDDETDAS